MVDQITAQARRSPWIIAWSDPVAGVHSFTQLLAFADLKDDGDYKLICCDYKANKLKVYLGTSVLYSADLKAKPVSMCTLYEGVTTKPCVPLVAIAVESAVYFFRDFAPYQRFELPPIVFSE